MTIVWLAITVLLSLLVANLWQDLRAMDALISRQRALIDRQTTRLNEDAILIDGLRASLNRPIVVALKQQSRDAPIFAGPSGPISLN
jgi:hypothetical protein